MPTAQVYGPPVEAPATAAVRAHGTPAGGPVTAVALECRYCASAEAMAVVRWELRQWLPPKQDVLQQKIIPVVLETHYHAALITGRTRSCQAVVPHHINHQSHPVHIRNRRRADAHPMVVLALLLRMVLLIIWLFLRSYPSWHSFLRSSSLLSSLWCSLRCLSSHCCALLWSFLHSFLGAPSSACLRGAHGSS